jgi:hypothetical protein
VRRNETEQLSCKGDGRLRASRSAPAPELTQIPLDDGCGRNLISAGVRARRLLSHRPHASRSWPHIDGFGSEPNVGARLMAASCRFQSTWRGAAQRGSEVPALRVDRSAAFQEPRLGSAAPVVDCPAALSLSQLPMAGLAEIW